MALHLHQLKKRFVSPDGSAAPVIDVESFSLADGEHVALVGGSGTGKTTLLHLIAGILTPDGGKILYDATTANRVDLAQLSEAERDVFRGRHIGYIFQTHHLLPGFTALENVLLGMSFTGRSADPAWAKHLLQAVGLADRLDYKPAKLSVGQQQRVAVARALANRPALVLADEPTGNLDEATADRVLDQFLSLVREQGSAALVATHNERLAQRMDRVFRLHDGRLE